MSTQDVILTEEQIKKIEAYMEGDGKYLSDAATHTLDLAACTIRHWQRRADDLAESNFELVEVNKSFAVVEKQLRADLAAAMKYARHGDCHWDGGLCLCECGYAELVAPIRERMKAGEAKT